MQNSDVTEWKLTGCPQSTNNNCGPCPSSCRRQYAVYDCAAPLSDKCKTNAIGDRSMTIQLVDSSTGSTYRSAGWSAIASGVIGIISFVCLIVYLATQADQFLNQASCRP